jgi:hypothetical protein
MAHTVVRQPLDLLRFVGMENEQFMVSLANNHEDFRVSSHLQGLYDAATANMTVNENEVVIFQLLTFTHYHFLFSTACMMRCHLSEAFASARVAIDAALIAAQIIHDRASQIAYVKKEKPFDNFARYLGNLIKAKKTLPHHLVETLFIQHKRISTFASHADVGSFVHRTKIVREPGRKMLTVEYFQFAQNADERQIHAMTLFHTYVMVLDVFSNFLVTEQKAVPVEWQQELHQLGQKIERRVKELKAALPTDDGGVEASDPS